MAGKKTGKRLLTWVLVLVMALSLLPLNALAAGGPETDGGSGMNFDKRLVDDEPDDEGNYTIRMTAQATGTTTTKVEPMDIVLVLDQSGSMADDFSNGTRQSAMIAAVNSFIGEVADKYSTDADHRMAIVTFGYDAAELVGWTAVDPAGATELTRSISNLPPKPEGATNVGAGMELAQQLMGRNYNYTGGNTDRQKTVIVFTDGVPTTSSDFDTKVANNAISAAKDMKAADVTIYTVGIFNGADPDEMYGASGFNENSDGTIGSEWKKETWGLFPGTDFPETDRPAGNRFLNLVSSNYLDASSIGLNCKRSGLGIFHYKITYKITENFNRDSSDYYLTASNASSLEKIFEGISSTVPAPVNSKLNKDTVITDTLSDYFTFALTEDGKVDVKVYAEKGNEKTDITDKVTVNPNPQTKTVTVTDYDFSKHHTESDDPEELVIEIKVKPSGKGCATAKIPTNEGNATVTLDNKEIDKATLPTVDGYSVEYVIGDGASWPNNGNGPEKLYYPQDADVAVTDSVPTRDGYEFTGWNTKEDGTGTTYKANGTLTITGNTTLYAQWKVKEYPFTVNYLWNGEAIQSPTTGKANYNDVITIKDTAIDGYTFILVQTPSMTIGTGENVLNLNYYKNVTLTAKSKTVTYNGEEQTVEGYTAKDNKNNPVEGLTFKDVTPPSASGTDAGTYLVKFAENAKDKVSDNNLYIVTKTVDGKLTIENRPITITADDVTVKYDGQPHGENGYSITSGSLVDSHAATVTISGSKTDAGEYEELLVPSVTKIVDAKGKDVTSYYDISYEDGKLTINKRSVTLTSASASKVYDGTPLTKPEVKVTGDGFVTGEGATYNVTGTITSVGTTDNTFTYTLNEGTKADNYNITKTEGKLTITEASAPTPGTFDFDDVVYGDGKVTPAITKTVKGNVGKNFTEAFYVTVKGADEKSTATMSAPSYTGEAKVIASKSLKDVPFLFDANDKLTFRNEGKYTYTVREEIPGKTSRMSYDTTEYTLTINVVLNKNTNKYEVESWQFTAGNRENLTQLNIVNTYRTYHPSTPSKPTLNTGDHYAYVMGYPDGTVRPNGSITRAEVSAILFRLLSDKTRDEYFTTESSFTDVKAGAWYNNSIATLEKAGVIVDTAKGGAFRPNEAITRAELAAMLAQFSDAKPVKGVKFSDVSAEHWAYEAIAIAAKMSWIEGYPDGTFRPDATITRAEMMTLVNRALERVPSDEDHLLSKRVMLTFPDCKSGDWFYIAVQEATNSHTYERAATEKNGDEQWTALRANRDWTLLEK